ncbi:MAG: hypothetical protein ACKV2V_19735 [Blastocatellia bacterium]
MTDVRIGKFATHYHLPASAVAARRRLSATQQMVLAETLTYAIERAGVPEHGELCIRRIRIRLRINLRRTDTALALAWGEALAAEIAAALRGQPSDNVVFYADRRAALHDMALALARGDDRRRWAWRRVGLWRAAEQVTSHEAHLELARALADDPPLIVAALRWWLAEGLLPVVLTRFTGDIWETLARAILAETGAADGLRSVEESATPTPESIGLAMRLLRAARLPRAFAAAPAHIREQAAIPLATLAVIEGEPALLRRDCAPALLSLVAGAIRRAETDAPPPLHNRAEKAAGKTEAPEPRGAETTAPEQPENTRRRAFTEYGGLLFLLGIIEDLGLPDALAANTALGSRPLRHTLHRLALTLVPAAPDDPAALAFAGLGPDATPPSDEESPEEWAWTETALEAVGKAAEQMVKHLATLLARPGETPAQTLTWVCRRRAEILADALPDATAWIDAHFSLDQAATDIRRAGLDLNPGYLSWLGTVVRFIYA